MQKKTHVDAEDKGELHDSECENKQMHKSLHEQSKVTLLAESDRDPDKKENAFNDLQLSKLKDENLDDQDIDETPISESGRQEDLLDDKDFIAPRISK